MSYSINNGIVGVGTRPPFRNRIYLKTEGEQALLTQADVSAASYTVYECRGDDREPIEGHTDVPLVVADIVFDELQAWDEDETGYNVELSLDPSLDSPFTAWGQEYLVAVTFELPAEGIDGYGWLVRTP